MNKEIGYGEEYHQVKHQHLYTNLYYYKVRAELAKRRYFDGIDDMSDDNANADNKRILEWGVGLGQNIFLFKDAGGYDVSEFAVNFCRKKGIYATTDVHRILTDYYDIILSAHVLEHVENPLETLRVIHSKLRKKGRLILITPINVPKKIGNWKLQTDVNQHLYTWTPQLMINLLIRAGFKPIENEIISTCAYHKLLFFRKFGLRVYDWAIRFAGVMMNDKELKFVAIKK